MTHDQRTRAVVFNAIQPSLAKTGDWVRLKARRNVAEAVLAALAEHGLAVVPSADAADRDEPENSLGQRYADAIRSVPIQLTPGPATTAMLQAYAPFHLSEEETAPLVDAALAVRDDELADLRRQWQDLRERLAEETWKREQAEAALARVRAIRDYLATATEATETGALLRKVADNLSDIVDGKGDVSQDKTVAAAAEQTRDDLIVAAARALWEREFSTYEECSHTWSEMPRIAAVALDAAGLTEPAPTRWAYNQACAALEKHRVRADQAEAAIARVRRLCELTISTSIRVQAIHQAHDTLAALDGAAAVPEQPRGNAAEPSPGTYWERAVLERFVTGGPVDMAIVRQQVAALLSGIPPAAGGGTDEQTGDGRG